jgi:hypothetical protein
MKTLNKEVLGFDVPIVGVAEDLNELLLLSGGGSADQTPEEQEAARKLGAEKVYAAAINYVHFHSHYTKVRAKMIETLVAKSGKKQTVDKEGNVDEKDVEYVGRLEDELGGAGSLDQYNDDIVAYTQSSKGGGSGTIGKKYLAYYDKMVEDGKLDAFVAKHSLEVEGLDEEAKKQVVGAKVKELVKAAERSALAGV